MIYTNVSLLRMLDWMIFLRFFVVADFPRMIIIL